MFDVLISSSNSVNIQVGGMDELFAETESELEGTYNL